jgi:hypothetical protein
MVTCETLTGQRLNDLGTLAWHAGSDVVLVARAACADSDVHAVGAELARVAARLDAIEVAA